MAAAHGGGGGGAGHASSGTGSGAGLFQDMDGKLVTFGDLDATLNLVKFRTLRDVMSWEGEGLDTSSDEDEEGVDDGRGANNSAVSTTDTAGRTAAQRKVELLTR